MKRKKKFIVSVHDFGAKGDGYTDDGPAFEAAKKSKADIIKVPKAKYWVSSANQVVDERFISTHRKGKRDG